MSTLLQFVMHINARLSMMHINSCHLSTILEKRVQPTNYVFYKMPIMAQLKPTGNLVYMLVHNRMLAQHLGPFHLSEPYHQFVNMIRSITWRCWSSSSSNLASSTVHQTHRRVSEIWVTKRAFQSEKWEEFKEKNRRQEAGGDRSRFPLYLVSQLQMLQKI